MTRTDALVRASVSSGRWLLPWIGVLVVAVTLTFAAGSLGATNAREATSTAVSRPCQAYEGAIGWMLDDLAKGRVSTRTCP